jgi:transposase
VDNLKVHHSKPVQEWLEENKDLIEVFYLPAHCPELNPDEYLNNDLKIQVYSAEPA